MNRGWADTFFPSNCTYVNTRKTYTRRALRRNTGKKLAAGNGSIRRFLSRNRICLITDKLRDEPRDPLVTVHVAVGVVEPPRKSFVSLLEIGSLGDL